MDVRLAASPGGGPRPSVAFHHVRRLARAPDSDSFAAAYWRARVRLSTGRWPRRPQNVQVQAPMMLKTKATESSMAPTPPSTDPPTARTTRIRKTRVKNKRTDTETSSVQRPIDGNRTRPHDPCQSVGDLPAALLSRQSATDRRRCRTTTAGSSDRSSGTRSRCNSGSVLACRGSSH